MRPDRLAKTLAIELRDHNIRANAIAPGAVRGQRINNVLAGGAKAEGKGVEDKRASMFGIQSLKRFVDPKGIAFLCVFLASDAGKSISGQVIANDGADIPPSRARRLPGPRLTSLLHSPVPSGHCIS
ncbi:MAG TPA: SDR family oxidoreductase [Verrucomicrobiae bacterium]|nr:SDR family oxidoreductase [Verrucomicrobiae bacterium]